MLSTVSLGNAINDFPKHDLNMDIKIRRKRNMCKIRAFRSGHPRGHGRKFSSSVHAKKKAVCVCWGRWLGHSVRDMQWIYTHKPLQSH